MEEFWSALFGLLPALTVAEFALLVIMGAVIIALGAVVYLTFRRKDSLIDTLVEKLHNRNGYLTEKRFEDYCRHHDEIHNNIGNRMDRIDGKLDKIIERFLDGK